MKARHQQGFTLIEIAIVLAVISLVLGGVLLAGNAIIERSRMASLIAKINDIAGASRTFKSKYGYFPGDMPNAKTYITANGEISEPCNYAPDGKVGNGLINSDNNESGCALEHLVKAGLLSKIEQDGSGIYRVSSGFDIGRVSLSSNASQNVVRITSAPCDIALEIDRKLDSDYAGTPLSKGMVLGFDTVDASSAAIATCSPGDPTKNDPVAALLIKY